MFLGTLTREQMLVSALAGQGRKESGDTLTLTRRFLQVKQPFLDLRCGLRARGLVDDNPMIHELGLTNAETVWTNRAASSLRGWLLKPQAMYDKERRMRRGSD